MVFEVMRILFDSKKEQFKTPFGTIRRGENCILHLWLPDSSGAVGAELVLEDCENVTAGTRPFSLLEKQGAYQVYRCEFSIEERGLYYYYFRILKKDGSFRLFKQGNGTNMEAGDKWQLSVIPEDFTVPDFAKGAVMYQIMPDRFYKEGQCDLTDKLRPFTVHENWLEIPRHTADAEGNWCNDFFGGNLAGIQKKLPYLQELGVEILYLNPIFMAYSNHRYDTADYKRIDPMLGTEEDFKKLCDEAHKRGMRIILDGVFSHTGSNSRYFDAKGVFGTGAVSDPNSPYREWFRFKRYPDKYEAWWDMPTLPNVEELTPSYMDYIIENEDSVVAHWLRLGADGFRLDVVDELPDAFVYKLKKRIREIKHDAMLIGEIWEDASNKRAYGESRRYFVDGELDSTMNYPWRTAILDFVLGKDDGSNFGETLMTLAENYPPQVLSCVMNLLGSHDTARILTVLADCTKMSKNEQASYCLNPEQRAKALHRLHLAAFLQFTLPGMASIYYGDEAMMEGFDDPFSRCCYPWGKEDKTLQNYFAALCRLKKTLPALRTGDLRVISAGQGRVAFERRCNEQYACVYVNLSGEAWMMPEHMSLAFGRGVDFDGENYALESNGFCILYRNKSAEFA